MLKVVYSNNMVQLAAQLADIQQANPLPPLVAETVIVQSNELARWLSLFLAQQHGIASHINFPYPSAYIWSLFRSLLPNIPQQSSFSTDAMAWRIFELLPDCQQQAGFELIDSYLGQQDDPVKRYALSHRIADSFDQYLMYRPDWIQAWEQGETPHWQAMLWQRLTQGESKSMHRANLLVQLHDYLASLQHRPPILPTRLAIFGLSALPPVYLKLFKLLARHCDIYLFFLSPSEQYWGDLLDPKLQAKRILDAPEQAEYLITGHPLLASLGKQGQEFFEQLQESEAEETDVFIPPAQTSLLGYLQHAIYSLYEPDATLKKKTITHTDDSIMVHACHSAMREIEVLHDQLLALFERRPELSPTDIVVMTPNIELYTPWIEAVFGCATSAQFIPYGIADGGIKQQSRLLSAFSSLLGLPQSRFDVESIVALLECEAIQNRFSLNQDQHELIRHWLIETHTRWGLSADDKKTLGLPAIEANTWRAGLDRLLMGYAMPLPSDDEPTLFDDKLGFDGISGERAETMAQLCAFVDSLDRYRQRLKSAMNAQQWQQLILTMLDDFFEISIDNSNEESQLLHIRKTLDSLVETTELAQFNQTMNIDLLKEWLASHLDAQQSQTRFMGQGVTFCGMVPMRSIPFNTVCLIGMNDESYPRRQVKAGFDLLSQTPGRKGDRSQRDEDRYLFLESLLSAQSHLYISYVGASIQDNSPIPPSVLVSDLRDALRQAYISEQGEDIWQHVLTEHPLQNFSQRYFNQSDSKLFSYVSAHCPPQKNEQRSWFEQALSETESTWRLLDLTQLLAFFSNPAKFLLRERLHIRLELDEQQLETREPFSLDHLQSWQLRNKLLNARIHDHDMADLLPVIKAEGILPHGEYGEQLFSDHVDLVSDFAEILLPEYPEAFLTAIPFELTLAEFTLSGQLDQVSNGGVFNYRVGKTNGRVVLATWLQHLVLNSIQPDGVQCESQLLTEQHHFQFQTVDNAQELLQQCLKLYWQGLHQPIPFFANSSYNFAKAQLKGNKFDLDKAWTGDNFTQGEAQDPYQQQLYTRSPFDQHFMDLAMVIYEPLLTHVTEMKL